MTIEKECENHLKYYRILLAFRTNSRHKKIKFKKTFTTKYFKHFIAFITF